MTLGNRQFQVNKKGIIQAGDDNDEFQFTTFDVLQMWCSRLLVMRIATKLAYTQYDFHFVT